MAEHPLDALHVAMLQLETMPRPALLRLGRDVVTALAMTALQAMMPTEWDGEPVDVFIPTLFSTDLPPDAWQVVDGDGTVLRDGRLP